MRQVNRRWSRWMPLLLLALALGCGQPSASEPDTLTADSAGRDSVIAPETKDSIEQKGSAVIVDEGQKAAFFQGLEGRAPFTELVMRDEVDCEEVGKICGLKGLTYLSLTNADCSELPEALGDLKSLQKLHFVLSPGQNTIPKPIFRLSALTGLHIEGDDLRKIPTEITQLRALEELNMGESPILDIPDFLGNMPSLKRIVLSYTDGIEEKAERFRRKYPEIEVLLP